MMLALAVTLPGEFVMLTLYSSKSIWKSNLLMPKTVIAINHCRPSGSDLGTDQSAPAHYSVCE
jgi:hypothetical protein